MALWGIFALGLIVICVIVLFFLKRGPARSSSDAQAIDRLMKAGSDLTLAHDIEFLFYFPSRVSADEAATRLKSDGYTVSVEEAATGTRCVLRATRWMVPVLREFEMLRSKFDELAAREGGLYESWRAEVVR